MDVRAVMIVIVRHFDQRDRRPVGDVSHRMLGLRHTMQVHRRQNGDGEHGANGASQCGHAASQSIPYTASLCIGQPARQIARLTVRL
jgi:hypothetical protein